MKWFDRWLMKRVQNGYNSNEVESQKSSLILPSEEVDVDTANTVRFHITPARGGSVVTVMRYDQRKDQNDKVVYVIDESSDVAKRVAEIVAMEMYRS